MKRIVMGLLVLTAALSWSVGVRADEKHGKKEHAAAHDKAEAGCAYCAAVEKIAAMIRCDECRDARNPCGHCKRIAEKIRKTARCKECHTGKGKGDESCSACAEANEKLEHAKCAFCAARKLVAAHVACCGKCAKKDEAARAQCKGCKEIHDAVMALECESCAAKQN